MKKFLLLLTAGLTTWWFWPQPRDFCVSFWEVLKEKYIEPGLDGFHQRAAPKVPPEVVKLIEEGLVLARQHQWQPAIEKFDESLNTRLTPEALFNLGLAQDRASHPLIALCWYEAYVQYRPDRHLTDQVKNRIAELDVLVEKNIQTLETSWRAHEREMGSKVPFIEEPWREHQTVRARKEVGEYAALFPDSDEQDRRIRSLIRFARALHDKQHSGYTINDCKLPPPEKSLDVYFSTVRTIPTRWERHGTLASTCSYAARWIFCAHEQIKLLRTMTAAARRSGVAQAPGGR